MLIIKFHGKCGRIVASWEVALAHVADPRGLHVFSLQFSILF